MRINLEQLAPQLKKGLPKVIWLAGDEPLQQLEAADLIRQQAQQAGLAERQVYEVGANFNWPSLLDAAASLSLFAQSKLIEVRLGASKTGKEGAEVVRKLCAGAEASSDTILFTSAKLDATQLKSAWVKAIDNAGLLVQIWPLNNQQLPAWISQRSQKEGLNLDSEAANLLAEKVEGNLLAAAQEIAKLGLIVEPNTLVSAPQLLQLIEDSSRYSLFDLADACLLGKGQRAVRILRGLQAEAVEAPLILWALTREIRTLNQLLFRLEGTSFNSAASQLRIWDNRKSLYSAASQRFNVAAAQAMLQLAFSCDQAIKGSGADVNSLLLQLVANFSSLSPVQLQAV